MAVIDSSRVEPYRWGEGCFGWHLLRRDDCSIIEESVPPGQAEQRHSHRYARQFFYLLQGTAVMEIDGQELILGERQGIEVPPGVPHRFQNRSETEVRFLVISVPKAHGDRLPCEPSEGPPAPANP